MSDNVKKGVELPPFYRRDAVSFKKRAQQLDKEYRHGWFKMSPANEVVKVQKGWETCEDKETLVRLGLGALINARGRAQDGELELWRMPNAVAALIKQEMLNRTAERSTSVRNSLEALAADTAGRSGGKVGVQIQAGYGGDIMQRQPWPQPKTGPMVTVPGKKE